MGSSGYNNNNSSSIKSTSTDQNKHQQLEPPMSSSSFSEYIKRLLTSRPTSNKSTNMTDSGGKKLMAAATTTDNSGQIFSGSQEKPSLPSSPPSNLPSQPSSTAQNSPSSYPWPKRPCRAPLLRKFAHPCICSQPNMYDKYISTPHNISISSDELPLYLYDPHTKKCLPTSRNRYKLLKECRSTSVAFPIPAPHGPPCVHDDLVCDVRRNRCTCRPPLHLYYESNQTSFGCVPIGATSSPDGRHNCKSGYVYNVISKDCQKIFDINELPPSYTAGVSATQFSFVTIVLIWILLLILIVTAKLRKLRTSNLYRNSPATERRLHQRSGSNSYRHQSQTASTWFHPFIAAVNGHHHLNQHRTTVDRHTQNMSVDDSGNYNDTDFFLTGTLRINDMLNDNNFVGSQHSLNNPPPKFEEIYPSCPEEQQTTIRPPSNEDLPSYDEAMKLQNTMPPDQSKE